MRTLLEDVRYGLRLLRRSPGFTAAAVLTLALGIGVNVAIFGVVNVFLLTPLAYDAPDRVAFVFGWNQKTQQRRFSLPLADVEDLRRQSSSFQEMAAYAYQDANLTGDAERPERVQAYRVTGSTFRLLGVRPLHGRTLQPEDAAPNAPDVAVLSYGLWQRRFGGESSAVGRTLMLNGAAYTIAGVMPRSFEFPIFNFKGEVWTPFKTAPADLTRGSSPSVVAVARLKSGVSYDQADGEVQAIMARLAVDYPQSNQALGARVFEMSVPNRELVTPAFTVVAVVVGLILLLSCANVANLLIARAGTRRAELALRATLGAGRGRIVRQLLTESLLLAAMGAGMALLGALWALRWLKGSLPDIVLTSTPHVLDLGVDYRTLGFTMCLAVVSTLLFGVAPAIRAAAVDLSGRLKEGERGAGGGARQRFRSALIVGEIAIALVVLIAAGLLLRSFAQLKQVDLGFQADHVATLTISLPDYRYSDTESYRQYFSRTLEQVQRIPGVRAAGFVNVLPFSTYDGDTRYAIDGDAPVVRGQEPVAGYRVATADYFTALRVTLHAGRAFDSRDRDTTRPVAIVNRSLAQRAFGDRSPLGQRIRVGDDATPWRTIVGVVGDMRHSAIDERPTPQVFIPFEQAPQPMMMLAVYTDGEPEGSLPLIQAALGTVDPAQPAFHVKSLAGLVNDAMVTSAWAMSMMSVLGLLALVLATVGIYAVVSYAVSQRGREFAMRQALGATPADVLRLVMSGSIGLIAAGTVLGVAGAMALGQFMRGLLYGVEPADSLTLAVALVALVSVSGAACFLPARRAMRRDPSSALRG